MAVDGGSGEMGRTIGVGRAAALLASSVLLSRLLGYGREMLLAYRAGAGASTDAYYAAFQIPDLLNYLLAGGALSVAFVPLYARHLARGEAEAADELFAVVLGTLGALAAVLTAVLWWFAEPLIELQFPRFEPPTRALVVRLTRIVLPAQVFFIVGGIVNAVLIARERFAASAAAPLLYNAGIIAGGLVLAPFTADPVEGFAWGALAGAVCGPFLAPLLASRGTLRLGARIAPADRRFLGYLAVAAPLMLGQSLLTVDEWYERWFGALLGAGAVAQLGFARKLMLVPVAAVGQAIAAAALPALSRLWASGARDELERVLLRTLQSGLALAILSAAWLFSTAPSVVHAVYRRGAFTAESGMAVATVLSLLCLAVPGWVAQQIAVRAFYARGDTWRPMLLGTAIALGAIPLYALFARGLGVLGLAAAGACAMSINALATLALARLLHGSPDLRALAASAARALAVATIAAVPASAAGRALPQSLPEALLRIGAASVLFAALALLGARLLGDEPMRAALGRVRGRLAGVRRGKR